jgi:arabinosaccharide transport system substrate-binding protein
MRDRRSQSGPRDEGPSRALSVALIAVLAVCSAVALGAWPSPRREGLQMWTFARLHKQLYDPIVGEWNSSATIPTQITLMGIQGMERRMLAAFLSGMPFADLVEVERANAGRAFRGPPDSVGFLDLTDLLRKEGLDTQINAPSFSPWSSRGRIYGLPHDVHPVMLGYRADLVEAAGIDVSRIETWEDYFREMAPLMAPGPDGKPAHYLLNLWETHQSTIEILLLQAGGGFFDADGRCVVDSDVNAHVLASMVGWCHGPKRVAADAPYFAASGNKLLLDGYVIASFMPDWMCNVWKNEIPQLAGKVKVMPLPAWTRGGRRTSVWGGTMLGIPRTTTEPEKAWDFAKRLYLSPELARSTYRVADIVTPVKALWADPVFDEPDPYFSGQPKGRLFIRLAPEVPARTGSPYNAFAQLRVQDALVALVQFAKGRSVYDAASLEPEARRLLGEAAAMVRDQMNRNVFAAASGGEDAG